MSWRVHCAEVAALHGVVAGGRVQWSAAHRLQGPHGYDALAGRAGTILPCLLGCRGARTPCNILHSAAGAHRLAEGQQELVKVPLRVRQRQLVGLQPEGVLQVARDLVDAPLQDVTGV